jgi:2-dehydro-3-deoxy-D-arabinonate dehydratase
MHLIRFRSDGDPGVGVLDGAGLRRLAVDSMAALLRLPLDAIRELVERPGEPVTGDWVALPPIDGRTEVWASGVTYLRSRDARIEETTQRTVYELVYDAARPELFGKAPAWRVVTDTEPIAVRPDSELDVPEPELAVLANAHAEIVGYLVCNDVSSRSIEGANPLYLPQAKCYAGSTALSALVRPAWEVDAARLGITLSISRDGVEVFTGATGTDRIRRTPAELLGYLFRCENHPDGAVLSTGTGIVPGVEFSLRDGDLVSIAIDGIATLVNPVVIGKEKLAFLADRVRRGVDPTRIGRPPTSPGAAEPQA